VACAFSRPYLRHHGRHQTALDQPKRQANRGAPVSRTSSERASILRRLAEKSPDALDALALQIPLRFSAAETLEKRIARLLPYVARGWVEL
jgi:hypothetical protein